MFRRAVSRLPTSQERRVLSDRHTSALATYQKNPVAAAGLAENEQNNTASEVAAWTVVASIILNLDEVITRE